MKNTKINARHLIIDLFLSSAYPQLSIKQILVAAKLFNQVLMVFELRQHAC
ncbi:paaX-like domain protein [Acinetobacter baumannii 45057_1]|nr:paaX-like domain protein [Acinetobacter baumannii 45057_1]